MRRQKFHSNGIRWRAKRQAATTTAQAGISRNALIVSDGIPGTAMAAKKYALPQKMEWSTMRLHSVAPMMIFDVGSVVRVEVSVTSRCICRT